MRYDLENVLAGVSVESILQDLGVDLVRGRARCPVCQSGNDQSMMVKGQKWSCFVCHKGGFVHHLEMALTGCGKSQAINALGLRYGLDPHDPTRPRPIRQTGPSPRDLERIAFQLHATRRDRARRLCTAMTRHQHYLTGPVASVIGALCDAITSSEYAMEILTTGDASERAALTGGQLA